MKIFGWIHCKLRNNGSATGLLKDSGNGNGSCLLMNPSWNNQDEYLRPKNRGTRRQPQHDHVERYLSECNMERREEDQFEESTFPGFLTIGTLNMELIPATEPATPTFGFLPGEVEEEAREDHNMEEMNYDLKLINKELEKFLKTEAENEVLNDSRRTSIASTITLSGKDKDDNESKTTFPLQGYLLASSYDLSMSEEEEEKEKVSLIELFRRSREADRNSCIKLGIIKEDQAIEKYIAPMHPLKRILQTLQSSSKKIQLPSSPTNKRFRKIKKLFQRKVHPEGDAADKDRKYKNEKTNICMAGNGGPSTNRKRYNKGYVESGDGTYKSSLKNKNNHTTNVEHWIKTDSDYFVLELGEK